MPVRFTCTRLHRTGKSLPEPRLFRLVPHRRRRGAGMRNSILPPAVMAYALPRHERCACAAAGLPAGRDTLQERLGGRRGVGAAPLACVPDGTAVRPLYRACSCGFYSPFYLGIFLCRRGVSRIGGGGRTSACLFAWPSLHARDVIFCSPFLTWRRGTFGRIVLDMGGGP